MPRNAELDPLVRRLKLGGMPDRPAPHQAN